MIVAAIAVAAVVAARSVVARRVVAPVAVNHGPAGAFHNVHHPHRLAVTRTAAHILGRTRVRADARSAAAAETGVLGERRRCCERAHSKDQGQAAQTQPSHKELLYARLSMKLREFPTQRERRHEAGSLRTFYCPTPHLKCPRDLARH